MRNFIKIGENIHVISKSVQSALLNRDEAFVLDLIKKQTNMDYIDLNVGPAKGQMEGVLPWLCNLVETNTDLKISFDTTNSEEMRRGLSSCKNTSAALLNSTSADENRLEKITDLAAEFNSNLIGLTLNKELGIPKSADDRLALAFEIYEKCAEKGIDNGRIFFDPLILPVSVDQSQAQEALNTIQMLKQSFDPEVMTTIGLSNISNGSPKEMRPLINRVFAALAFGAGLDSAIVDAFDTDLINMLDVLKNDAPKTDLDRIYIELAEMMQNFSTVEEISYDKSDVAQVNVIKTVRMLLGKEIYTHSFTQI